MLHSAPLFSGAQMPITIEALAPFMAMLVFGLLAALPRILVWLLQDPKN